MREIRFYNGNNLKVINENFWEDQTLLYEIEKRGFRNVDWEHSPNELLLYLFIQDEPIIGKNRAYSTKKEYFREMNQFLLYIYELNLNSLLQVQPEQLLAYQRYLEPKYKTTTLQRKSSIVKQFYRYLRNKRILQQDITNEMKKFKPRMNELVNRDLYDHEVSELLEYFKKTNWFAYSLFYVLVSSGMRINELATAKWSNLRFEPKVGYHFLMVTGKGDVQRNIIIFEDVLEVLIENRRRKSLNTRIGKADGTAFFPKVKGEHYNSTYLSNEFSRLVNEAPFEFINSRFEKEKISADEGTNIRYRITPHTCRHYTAAYYMDQGIDAKAVQDMLGHRSLMTTERYLRRKRKVENHAGVQLGNKKFKL
jgi:site-specific recombinase XerD